MGSKIVREREVGFRERSERVKGGTSERGS